MMKLKVDKKKHENILKRYDKRVKLNKTVRMIVIGIFVLLLLLSSINVYGAYQNPIKTKSTITKISFYHKTDFDYKAYLKNNSLYSQTYLSPGTGILYKKIIKNIQGSFDYSFRLNGANIENISGTYSLIKSIQTEKWTKNYNIISQRKFFTTNFSEDFPIDYNYYYNITKAIEDETGVSASSPTFVIKLNIFVKIKTYNDEITENLNPTLSIPMGGEIIEMPEDISLSFSDSIKEDITIDHPEVAESRNKWTYISILFFVLFVIALLFTKSDSIKLNAIDKRVLKIKKKYGDWLIEIENPPKNIGVEIINLSSIDDLSKISEELAKPMMHYKKSNDRHFYYVLDEDRKYTFTISEERLDSENK